MNSVLIKLFTAGLFLSFTAPTAAERVRISPEDLRLRVAVSEALAPSVRRELRDLAEAVPIPIKDGVFQSEELLQKRFAERDFKDRETVLIRYYFLIARMEQSQQFGDEFLRRKTALKKGRRLLEEYIEQLNRYIARAIYTQAPEPAVPRIQEFPLHRAEKTEDGQVEVLHRYPRLDISLGRNNLKTLRSLAESEKQLLKEKTESLNRAEKEFTAEVSAIGQQILDMRPQVRRWVDVPGEGLPFSL